MDTTCRLLIIISLVFVNLKSIHCSGELVYVSPNPRPNPDYYDGLPCQTLKSYFNNKTFTQQSVNLTMIFLPGEHIGLRGGQKIELKSTSFTIRGTGQLEVVVKDVNIELQYATEIRFENITLHHWNSISPGSPFLVFQILSVLAENQTHIFIKHGTNSSQNKLKLVNSVFNNSSLAGRLSFIESESNTDAMSLTSSTLNIGRNTNITFMKNLVRGAALYLNSSTLTIESNVHMAPNFQISTFNIRNCARIIFFNNLARRQAGGIRLKNSVLNAEDNANIAFITNSAKKIGSTAVLSSKLHVRHNASLHFVSNSASTFGGSSQIELSIITIENNAHITFTNNVADTTGGMVLRSLILNISHNAHILFNNNLAVVGGALYALNSTIYVKNDAQMTFINNNAAFSAGAFVLILSEMHLKSHTILTFINNTAINLGGAIFSYSSKLFIENATIKFTSNSARNGGAMALLSSTLELVNGSTNLNFENNSAREKGGAIYIDPDQVEFTSQVRYNTFYYLHEKNCLYTNPTSTKQYFNFVNNVAQVAGDDVYGASLEWCSRSVVNIRPKNNSSLSSISGSPTRVCRCDNKRRPLCRNISYNHISRSYYPGETIPISVVVVGGDLGATPGMVYARFHPPHTSILKPSTQYNQWINESKCTSLNYTMYSNQPVQLVLSTFAYTDLAYFQTCNNDNMTQQFSEMSCTFFSPLYIYQFYSPTLSIWILSTGRSPRLLLLSHAH